MPRTPPALSVVHVLAPARFGGAETALTALASGLKRAGESVCVAPVLSREDASGHPLVEALGEEGVDVVPIIVGDRDYLLERRRVRDVLRLREARVMHTHGFRADVVDAPIARKMGVATVTTLHGFTGGGWRSRLYERLQVRSLRRFDGVVAVSEQLHRDVVASGVDPAKVYAVRNAWPSTDSTPDKSGARRRLGLPLDTQIVGWVGRMTEEKAPDVMVRVAARVAEPAVLYSMIGAGPMERQCRELAQSTGIGERIRWHGLVAEAGKVVEAFDALVLTSWTEGTPMVLLEAMAAGVPVVTTAVGGIPDVVSPAEARLCQSGAVDEIADAVRGVLRDPLGARARAEAARRRLQRDFAPEPWVRRYRSIYEAAVGE